MQRGRELTVPHLQKHFCEAGNAGRGFAMSDIRLDRSDGALLRRGGLVSLAQAGYLDGISQRRAGAVRFDVADGRCVNASLRKRVVLGGKAAAGAAPPHMRMTTRKEQDGKTLIDGKKGVVRPLTPDDEKEFHQFFQGIPEPERMFSVVTSSGNVRRSNT